MISCNQADDQKIFLLQIIRIKWKMSFPVGEEAANIKRRLLSPDGQKSYDKALHLKELGNTLFRKKHRLELYKALRYYSKALLFAPWPTTNERAKAIKEDLASCKLKLARMPDGTEVASSSAHNSSLLATCFGNRSAVLYELGKFEECLADIKRALSLDFPEASGLKLYRRQAWCWAEMGREKEAQEALDNAVEMIKRLNQSQGLEQLQKEQYSLRKKLHELLKSSKCRGRKADTQLENLEDLKICGAYESKHLHIRSAPGKGRYLEASHSIEPGEMVILEEPFAAVLKEEFMFTHCSHCFQESTTLIPCCWCASEGYCSSQCRQVAWKKYHWVECPVTHLWKKYDWMLQLCLRMVLSADPTELLAVIENQCTTSPESLSELSKENHYRSIYSLVAHEDKFSDASQKMLLEKMANAVTECFGEVILKYLQTLRTGGEGTEKRSEVRGMVQKRLTESEDKSVPTLEGRQNMSADQSRLIGLTLPQLRSLFFHHLLQLRCNAHSISAIMAKGEGVLRSDGGSVVQTTSEVQLGSAVYPTASIMNHSCYPNAIFRFTGNRVIVCATKEILAGEEVNNCYGPQVGRMKRIERQAELKRRFFFDCHCPACEGATPELQYREAVMDAFTCPVCQGALQELDDEYHQCLKCKHICKLLEEKRTLKEARSMVETACTHGDTFNIPLLLKCQKLKSKVLHAHNMELAHINDTIARAYATQGDFHSACDYGELSCQAVEVVHGDSSIELGNELQKLAQLFFHRYAKALEVAQRALGILSTFHSTCHPDCIELREMIELLSA